MISSGCVLRMPRDAWRKELSALERDRVVNGEAPGRHGSGARRALTLTLTLMRAGGRLEPWVARAAAPMYPHLAREEAGARAAPL